MRNKLDTNNKDDWLIVLVALYETACANKLHFDKKNKYNKHMYKYHKYLRGKISYDILDANGAFWYSFHYLKIFLFILLALLCLNAI